MKIVRILFVIAAMVAVGLALVHLRNQTRQGRYAISRMIDRQQVLKRETLDLQYEIARLRTPARLGAENDRQNLDLVPSVTLRSAKGQTAAKGD
jgi:uncharacterized membrane-anchored protein